MWFPVVAALTFLGLAVWLIGQYFDYMGIAALGATIVIIAGSAVAVTGIDIRTGQVTSYEYTEINNTTVRESASVDYRYETTALSTLLNVGAIAPLGLGGLLMLLGGTLMSQTLSQEVA